jgi:hypothetical protein
MKLGLDWMGVPCLMGLGFSPKPTFDLLDDLSYLSMLSGALGGSMLWLLDNLVYFHRYGRTGWFGWSYFFHSKCSLLYLQLFCTRNLSRGGTAVPHGLSVPRETFQINFRQRPSKDFVLYLFFKIEIKIETKGKKNNYIKGNEKQLKQKERKLVGSYLDGDLSPPS